MVNHYPAKLINLYFYPLQVVSPYRDPELNVSKNYDPSQIIMFKYTCCSQYQ